MAAEGIGRPNAGDQSPIYENLPTGLLGNHTLQVNPSSGVYQNIAEVRVIFQTNAPQSESVKNTGGTPKKPAAEQAAVKVITQAVYQNLPPTLPLSGAEYELGPPTGHHRVANQLASSEGAYESELTTPSQGVAFEIDGDPRQQQGAYDPGPHLGMGASEGRGPAPPSPIPKDRRAPAPHEPGKMGEHKIQYTAYPPPNLSGSESEIYASMQPGYVSSTSGRGRPIPKLGGDLNLTTGYETATRKGQIETLRPFQSILKHQNQTLSLVGVCAGNEGAEGAEFVQQRFGALLEKELAAVPLTKNNFRTAINRVCLILQQEMKSAGIHQSTGLSISLATDDEIFTADVGNTETWVQEKGQKGQKLSPEDESTVPGAPHSQSVPVQEDVLEEYGTTRRLKRSWSEGNRNYEVTELQSHRGNSIVRRQHREFSEGSKRSETYVHISKSFDGGKTWVRDASDIGTETKPTEARTNVIARTSGMRVLHLSPQLAQCTSPDSLEVGREKQPHAQATALVQSASQNARNLASLGAVITEFK